MPTTASTEEGAFLAPWKPNDASSLQPDLLPIAKVTRAWERRPQAPSSRVQKRVGTIWKRPAAMTPSFSFLPHIRGNFLRRKSGGNSSSPRIAAKKQCVETEFGMGSTVSQWEVRGSPTRKIVTRSDAVADQELMSLPEQEDVEFARTEQDVDDEEEEGDVTVEILDEDGTVVAVGDQSLGEGQDWVDFHEDVPFDDTLMHLEDAVNHPQLPIAVAQPSLPTTTEANSDIEDSPAPEEPLVVSHIPKQEVILPEGFVSPVKQRRQLGGRARQAASNRRRTLPVQFAPSLPGPEVPQEVVERADTAAALVSPLLLEQDNTTDPETATSEINTSETEEDEEWEDVEEEHQSETRHMSDEEAVAAQLAADIEASQSSGNGSDDPDETMQESDVDVTLVAASPSKSALSNIMSERALTSSPIPTISGPHPRLPLRRSPRREPRRQSTSPLKQSTVLSDPPRSHLIAFTPLRRPFASVLEAYSPAKETPTKETSPLAPPSLERSASAPTFEAKMSPTKPARPRVSDDTALLQAFLNRAAESKTTRQSSAFADVEAQANRRDSDTVKKALASPGPSGDVLGELDPNSPSPRKSVSIVPESPLSRRSSKAVEDTMDQDDETISFDTDETVPRTRSGRARKRPQLLSQSAAAPPNRIQIRGQTGAVDIRKSEAQETALLTRNNTRKNKGQAIFPSLRLKKLASSESGDETAAVDTAIENATTNQDKRKRNVTWAENLVAYSGDLVEPETSVISVDAVSGEQDMGPAAPPPADTPSKPKIRRLRTTRTAAAPGTVPSSTATTSEPMAKSASSGVKRKPRIGTPAKGLGCESLLPDLDPIEEPAAEAAPAVVEKKPVAKRRATSRIPAPASSFTALGKENLISSPPKKKAASTLPAAKSFAPKLEFVKSTSINPPAAVPGLASPAKKAGRKMIHFNSAEDTKGQSNEDTMMIPGLASPAKKRTRRTVV